MDRVVKKCFRSFSPSPTGASGSFAGLGIALDQRLRNFSSNRGVSMRVGGGCTEFAGVPKRLKQGDHPCLLAVSFQRF